MNSILTKYTNNCIVCGTPLANKEFHHCVFGRGMRNLADEDKLVLPMCRICHEELHTKSSVAAELSRICGQLAYEKALCEKGMSGEDAREQFRKRYGVSYL
jgi:hypothetical protein